MITLSIILICSVLIYLVWNQYELFKLQNNIKHLNNEFNAKTIEKFVEIETDLTKIKDWQNWTDGKTFSNENHIDVLNKNLNDTSKYLINLEKKVNNIKKTKKNDFNNCIKRVANFDSQMIKLESLTELLDNTSNNLAVRVTELEKTIYSDFDSILINDKLKYLENEIDKLKMITSSPVFESYKSFIAELENHKSKIRTSKGRVNLNKELIEKMITDGKIEYFKSYSFAELQTILMEYLQCKKTSTTSKILRLTEKGLLKRYRSEKGSIWSVNI